MGNGKKVALVTCYFQPNYGSQLQAYATQRLFDGLGVGNETVRVDGLLREIRRAKLRYFLGRAWDVRTVMDKWPAVKKAAAALTGGRDYRCGAAARREMFREFARSRFRLSRRYGSKAALAEAARSYGAFVVGSDQLWLPSNIEGDYYTLNFVPEDVPKIALSTSFGVSRLPGAQAAQAARFLARLDFISVREEGGRELVRRLTGRDVPVTCDPALLLKAEEWDGVAGKGRIHGDPYLFCYFLGGNPRHRRFAARAREATGYEIVQLAHCDEYVWGDRGFPDHAPYGVGPADFVRLIRDAECVFTDSFHATAFSLLFGKKFFAFRRYGADGPVSTNGRLYSLLAQTGQEDRLLEGDEDVEEALSRPADRDRVLARLGEMRRSTMDYVGKALDGSGISRGKVSPERDWPEKDKT